MLEQFRKCLSLFDRGTLWQGIAVAILVLVAALLEALGIGLIFAFVNALVDPGQINRLGWLKNLAGPLFVADDTEFLIALAIGLLATFVAKNVILLGFYYVQARFVTANEARMAKRLLESYLKGAYALHLTRNSAEFIRNIISSVTAVFSTVIMGFINLAAELVLMIALAAVLLMAEPLLTFCAAIVLGSTVTIFATFSKRRFVTWGEQEQQAAGQILKSLQQGFHNIKEVKILGCEPFILESFKEPRTRFARILTNVHTMTNAPRLWVESVTVTAVLLAVVFIFTAGGGSAKILATLTLFAAAAFRMIPSMNRIIIALNGIKNGSHAVDLVYDDLQTFGAHPDYRADEDGQKFSFDDVIAVEAVSFSYEQGDGAVLEDVNLVLRKGESLGLVGPSGAGKSTLVDIVLGLLVPASGRVTVDGTDISSAPLAWRRQIGYVPQSIYIIDDTLRRNIAFGLKDDEIDETRLLRAIRLAQLEDFVDGLSDGWNTRLGEMGIRLSGGQRQRVGIARALYRDPEVVVLDEATSSLDSETEQEINNAIERLSGEKTLIIIAHRLSTVRNCSRLAFIRDGRIIDTGNFDDLAARNADFNRMVKLSQL